jgi:tRNA dimethylallyltransferase
MLVYKGLNIGTAKPSIQELSAVPHHLIDEVYPWQEFNAREYLNRTDRVCHQLKGRCLGVGGSPFYIKVLRDGLSHTEDIPDLEKILQRYSEIDLRTALKRLDPEREQAINSGDRFRLVRALTLIYSSGKKASLFKPQQPRPGVKVEIVALRADRKRMHEKQKARIDNMFAQGLLDEAKALFDGPKLSKSAAAAVGYKELFAHFRGEMDLETAKEKILIGTRRLYKHQMTWLKKLDVTWVDIDPDQPDSAWPKLLALAERHFSSIVK